MVNEKTESIPALDVLLDLAESGRLDDSIKEDLLQEGRDARAEQRARSRFLDEGQDPLDLQNEILSQLEELELKMLVALDYVRYLRSRRALKQMLALQQRKGDAERNAVEVRERRAESLRLRSRAPANKGEEILQELAEIRAELLADRDDLRSGWDRFLTIDEELDRRLDSRYVQTLENLTTAIRKWNVNWGQWLRWATRFLLAFVVASVGVGWLIDIVSRDSLLGGVVLSALVWILAELWGKRLIDKAEAYMHRRWLRQRVKGEMIMTWRVTAAMICALVRQNGADLSGSTGNRSLT